MTHPAPSTRRVLLTGGTGYIGARLAARLVSAGWQVFLICRAESDRSRLAPWHEEIHFLEHDGSTEDLVRLMDLARPEMVIHLATSFIVQHAVGEVEKLIRANVLFGTQLLEAMRQCGVRRLINTGTAWQHYEQADYNPVNLYAASKQAFESILAYYTSAQEFSALTLVLFDTYGPADPRKRLLSALWESALQGSELSLSPGEQQIDMTYIDDVLDAYQIAMERLQDACPGHERYGISGGRRLTLRQFVDVFTASTGAAPHVTWGGRPYREREVMEPWSAFQSLPGWEPATPLETGLPASRPGLT